MDAALGEAQALIARHGLTVGEMVEVDLDPERVGTVVLQRGAQDRRLLDEDTRELSAQVVHFVYAALLQDDAGLPGVEAEFRRAMLAARRDLPQQVADAVAARLAPPPGAGPPDLRQLFQGVIDRHALFAGRKDELAALDRELRGQAGDPGDAGRYVCVSAPAGFGKSALLAHWLRSLDPGADVAFAFVNRLAGTAEESIVLRALCRQLAPAEDVASSPDGNPADLRARLRELLTTRPGRRPSVVLIDGLDEADWLAPGLLPEAPPPGRLIVLSRRASDDAWIDALGLRRTAVSSLRLGTLGGDDIASVLRAAGEPAAAFATDTAFVDALRAAAGYGDGRDAAGGDPLVVRLLVEDVREGHVASVADLRRRPAGLKAYFDGWWEEITAALTGAVLRDLLGYLLAAKGPLARAELAAVDDGDALDEFGREGVPALEAVLARARRFLAGDDAGLALGHPRFEAYLRENRFPAALAETYAARLSRYCARWPDVQRLGPYALEHRVEHLIDGNAIEDACDALTDPRFLSAKARALGIDALLADFDRLLASPAARADPAVAEPAAVRRALGRARMALAREPEQLAAQLQGRLLGRQEPRIRQLLAHLGDAAPGQWLAARTPALASEEDLDATVTMAGTVRALAFGSWGEGTILAVGVDDRVSIHDPLKGASERATIPNDGLRVTALGLGILRGRPVVAVAAGYDQRLTVRDARTGAPVGPAVALPGYADSVAVGTLGDALVIAAAGNGGAWAWNADSGEPLEIASDALRGALVGVATLDGRVTCGVMATRDGGTPELLLVDAASRDELAAVFQGIALAPRTFTFARVAGRVLLALLSDPASCGLWSADTGDAVGPYLDFGDAPVRCIALGEAGGRPLVAAALDYAGTGVILLREAGESRMAPLRRRPVTPAELPILGLLADASGTVTALTGLSPSLCEFHAEGEEPLTRLEGVPTAPAVALLLTGESTPHDFRRDLGGSAMRLVNELDLGARGTADAELLRRSDPVQWPATARCWAVVDDRPALAVGSFGGAVWLWDVDARAVLAGPFADVPDELVVRSRRVKAARPPHVTSIAIGRTADRGILATACAGRVQLWDVGTGARLAAPDAGDEVVDHLAIGRTGDRDVLVTGSRGGVLRLWDVATGQGLAAITLDSGLDGVWIVREAGAVAALTADAHLHAFDVRAGGDRRAV